MRKRLPTTLLLTLLLTLTWSISFAQETAEESDSPCASDPASYWICAGDKAWDTGYLVPPSVLDLRQCMVWEECCALIPNLEKERGDFQTQRDKALKDIELWQKDYEELSAHSDTVTERYNQCSLDLADCSHALEDRYETWEVALIGAGTGLGALLVGLVVGGFAL